jgi:hypothetical protein
MVGIVKVMTLADLPPSFDEPMHKPVTTFTAGQIVLFTAGEYSDYGTLGLMKIERDFDVDARFVEFQAHCNLAVMTRRREYFLPSDFLAWLSTQGYISDFEHTELCLNDYEYTRRDGPDDKPMVHKFYYGRCEAGPAGEPEVAAQPDGTNTPAHGGTFDDIDPY